MDIKYSCFINQYFLLYLKQKILFFVSNLLKSMSPLKLLLSQSFFVLAERAALPRIKPRLNGVCKPRAHSCAMLSRFELRLLHRF